MEKDVIEFQKIKDRIRKEQRFGDVKRACDMAGYTPTTYRCIHDKKTINDLTDGERKVLECFISVLDERAESLRKINDYAKQA